jgi:predicted nucleic acid-binding protein
VTRASRKYVLDTQLFINAFHDPGVNEELQQFHRAFSPFEHLSVIVAQELRAGVQRPQDRKALERNILKVFQRANRTITPSADAWHRSGDLLAEMARQEGPDTPRVSKAFANDILLALSCREAGCVLVTDNERDFQRIRRFLQFHFMKPWPGGQVS